MKWGGLPQVVLIMKKPRGRKKSRVVRCDAPATCIFQNVCGWEHRSAPHHQGPELPEVLTTWESWSRLSVFKL